MPLGHAREHLYGMGEALYTYTAVVTVSGDGLFQEALNGIMTRPDWEKAAANVRTHDVAIFRNNFFFF